MNELIEWVKTQIANNDFAAGGALVVIMSAVMYQLRALPLLLWGAIKRLLTATVSFDERSGLYEFFDRWVDDQQLVVDKRDVVLRLDERTDPPKLLRVPDRRSYLVRIGGVRCILTRGRDDEGKAGKAAANDDDGYMSMMAPERYWVKCFIWQRNAVLNVLKHIATEYGVADDDNFSIHTYHFYWKKRFMQPKKDLDSVILAEGLMDDITADIGKFLCEREWYEQRQIPYQRGYMLAGPPGTGKTSLVQCLASHFGLRLCVLDLGSVYDDRSLKEAFIDAPGRSIILIEDFDSFFDGRTVVKTSDSQKITFSGFLNAVNGVVASPGRILIMTTNKTEQVDPALIRVGRVDRTFHLGYVVYEQVVALGMRFFGGGRVVMIDGKEYTKAGIEHETQEHALQAMHAFAAEIANLRDVTPADLLGHWQMNPDYERAFNTELFLQQRNERTQLDADIRKQAIDELAAMEAAAPAPVDTEATARALTAEKAAGLA